MAGIKSLVLLAFAGSIGMTLVILACALPNFGGSWFPFLVVIFYILAPFPTLIARRYTESHGQSNACLETGIFLTMGFVVSSFALPIVLARAPEDVPVIKWGAAWLTIAGNVVVYLTLYGFFIAFDQDDGYGMW